MLKKIPSEKNSKGKNFSESYSRIAPLSADVTSLAYRAKYPVLIFGSGAVQTARRFASSSSLTFRVML